MIYQLRMAVPAEDTEELFGWVMTHYSDRKLSTGFIIAALMD
jgi:hypothetical protein